MKNLSYDVIIIGSGMGGLTAGSLLAQIGKKRVLVLERHFKFGGFTHSFRRGKYEWDVGVHYVGEMQAGALARRLMDIVTQNGVKWHPMNSTVEEFIFPEGRFAVDADESIFQRQLVERFPEDAKNIKDYFRDLRKAQHWIGKWFVSKQYSDFIGKLLLFRHRKLVEQTTSEYMQKFNSPLLRAFLTSQWPDCGTPPDESAFAFHATIAADFLNGGYYPVGGSKEIANHACQAITDHGGDCLVNHEVLSINVKNGKACGVTALHKGEAIQFSAPIIISNAGAWTTFNKMVDPSLCGPEREKANRLKPGPSANILFLGLNDDPRNHGFDDRNYWIYSRLDHDTQARIREGQPERLDGAFVSFGSLRNPGQTAHTAQIITFGDQQPWERHSETAWKRRGEVYEEKKARITEEMLDYAAATMPGLKELVSYKELSTPLTVNSFTGHPGGQVYGQACDANRLFRDKWTIRTSLKNLYLTGSDVGTPGVNGAMMAGVMTAAKVLGPFGLPRIMTRAYTKAAE